MGLFSGKIICGAEKVWIIFFHFTSKFKFVCLTFDLCSFGVREKTATVEWTENILWKKSVLNLAWHAVICSFPPHESVFSVVSWIPHTYWKHIRLHADTLISVKHLIKMLWIHPGPWIILIICLADNFNSVQKLPRPWKWMHSLKENCCNFWCMPPLFFWLKLRSGLSGLTLISL